MALTDKEFYTLRTMATGLASIKVQSGTILEYADLEPIVDQVILFSGITVTSDEKKRLIGELEYEYKVTHTPGACIFDDYDDPSNWYTSNPPNEGYYWPRYRNYLLNQSSLDINSINKLDDETLPNIMDCLGDPKEELEAPRLKRGLIIGDVQSGKTATYAGLICKAADAGYKVVILLAGTTENLRQQTQERIDAAVTGQSRRKVGKKEQTIRVGVGLDNQPFKAVAYTSAIKDFVGDCDNISASLKSHNSLVVFVLKKNVSVLQKLYNWLKSQNLDPVHGYVDVPMLLIDDEADNASVNTKKEDCDPTRTNAIIRQICTLFKNSTYVGFTATPFANVFIDPDSVDAMKNADLFPQHFIYTLPTPSNYIGAKKIFFEDGKYYGNLRFISDIEEPDYTSDEYRAALKEDMSEYNSGSFYSRHRKEWKGVLPDSLRESIYCFFLANAILDIRGLKDKPRSMLINMSRFVSVQRYIAEYVDNIYESFLNTVRFDFSGTKEDEKLSLYKELCSLWEKHFSSIKDVECSDVIKKSTLLVAIERIEVRVINGSKSSAKLDYRNNPSLRVIAVGGLALSRGLTLEGLLVSFFYRNTATFDVLMQMGRWFGYRHKYDDVFQIWTSQVSAEWYAEIAKASEELKEDLRRMYEDKLTPKEFGIKVRDDSQELQITAANKMRSAQSYYQRDSYYGNIYDTPYISSNVSINEQNHTLIAEFARILFKGGYRFDFADSRNFGIPVDTKEKGDSRYFADVPKHLVREFLSKVKCSMANVNFNTKYLIDFLDNNNIKELENWDVVFQGGVASTHYDIEGLESIQCVERAIVDSTRRVIQISTRRRLLGGREGKFALPTSMQKKAEEACKKAWEDAGESVEGRAIPVRAYFEFLPERKPILIVMLIQPKAPSDDKTKEETKLLKDFRNSLGDNKICAFAIGLPGIEAVSPPKHYMVNPIFIQKLFEEDFEEIEEDDEDDEE